MRPKSQTPHSRRPCGGTAPGVPHGRRIRRFTVRSSSPSRGQVQQTTEPRAITKADLERKVDAAGWGVFFVWMGIALLADVGWGVGLLGVGIITLGGQLARRHFDVGLDGFWVVVGLLFLAGGVWELAGSSVATPDLPHLESLSHHSSARGARYSNPCHRSAPVVHSWSTRPQLTTTLSINHNNHPSPRSPVASLSGVVECCGL
jgi:hypothetical protein